MLTLCVLDVSGDVVHSLSYRNGVLIDHRLTEVNGQNVIGIKDKEIAEVFKESPHTLTITFMPSFIYDHMMKK